MQKEWQKYFAPNPSTASSLQTKTTTPTKIRKELLSVAFSNLWLSVSVRKAFRFRRGVGRWGLIKVYVRNF